MNRIVTTLGFVLASLPLMSCSADPEPADCAELETWLFGREADLDTSCAVDRDCTVAYVWPDRPVAARAQPADPALERVLRTWGSQCGELGRFRGIVQAVCEADLNVFEGEAGSGEGVPRHCVLRGDVPKPDIGGIDEDATPDAPSCECSSTQACGSTLLCDGCACVPDNSCGRACVRANVCGSMAALGLGTTTSACVASCESAVERNPTVANALVGCLLSTECGSLPGCFRGGP